MADTKIEWTDATWNPIRGCSRVSEGCRHCYAEKVAYRFSGAGLPYEGLAEKVNGHAAWTGEVRFVEEHLLDPLRWEEPRRIFVNSMSDLFHDNVITDWIVSVFAVMALTPQHTYQVLTKRADNVMRLLNDPGFIGRLADRIESMRTDTPRRAVGPLPHLNGGETWFPLANVWLGVSVENQAAADERIPLLLETPAAVRFISAEPLLGTVELCRYLGFQHEDEIGIENVDQSLHEARALGMHDPWVRGLDWVICGGESGPGARPMEFEWAESIVNQCKAAGVACFVKQMGSGLAKRYGWKSAKGGDWHEWPTGLMVREFPESR